MAKSPAHPAEDEGPQCRLYLITPPAFEPRAFALQLEAALDAGDVAAVQLRLKGASDAAVVDAGMWLAPLIQDRGVALILNDRPDLAGRMGADGVHVGEDDMPVAQARKLLGSRAMIGASAYDSKDRAIEAADAGADYVAFGAVYPTTTKVAKTRASLDLFTWWQEMMTVPCVAIGGIGPDNAEDVAAAGADFLAVSAGVFGHPAGPADAVRQLEAAIARGLDRRNRT
ncbi:thiamine phosphate synthase [Zavarzinia sp. CC-PAN008]|uniref:thiamine phosphate synthase n=1 Tax=Zavarzinia sp. CC-PAN008 TaxID=3243332 RepID=UPI003F745A82